MMKRSACAIALVLLSLTSPWIFAAERENPLEVWMSQFRKSADGAEAPVSVTSKFLSNGDVPSIRFRLTNISAASLHSYPFQLPWGHPDSISLVAVRSDGRVLPNGYRIRDPGPADQLEIRPGESREGAYRIEDTVRIEPTDREQDIFVAWSYLWWGPGSKRPSSPVTGVVVIPARKATSIFSSKPTP